MEEETHSQRKKTQSNPTPRHPPIDHAFIPESVTDPVTCVSPECQGPAKQMPLINPPLKHSRHDEISEMKNQDRGKSFSTVPFFG
jgi:hypothetical protein